MITTCFSSDINNELALKFRIELVLITAITTGNIGAYTLMEILHNFPKNDHTPCNRLPISPMRIEWTLMRVNFFRCHVSHYAISSWIIRIPQWYSQQLWLEAGIITPDLKWGERTSDKLAISTRYLERVWTIIVWIAICISFLTLLRLTPCW